MTDRLTNLTREQADLAVLVLKSQGIDPYIESFSGKYQVIVKPEEEDPAEEALEAYYRENRPQSEPEGPEPIPLTWRSATSISIMFLLVIIHFFALFHGIHSYLIKTYGCSALYILQGSYYRAMTALMLHTGIEHLAGNLAGIFIFGTGLLKTAGFGTGALIMLFSGFFGNILNAWFFKAAHLSIGASTSVMGAAGALTAFQVVRRRNLHGLNAKTLVPAAAGLAILGMLSGGENTDVSAHMFGFLSGAAIGLAYFSVKGNHKVSTSKERVRLAVCAAAMAVSWLRLI